MFKKALAQMSNISVEVGGRSNPFVDLCQMHPTPVDLLSGQITKHDPRGVPATDGHDKAPALSNCRSSLGVDDCGGLSRHCVGICKYFNLHDNVSDPG